MDKDLANIIRNNIPNDYCKRLCLDVMEEERIDNSLSDFTDEKIMLYCLIYGDSYFVNRIYKEKDFSKISHSTINFRYIYLYNLFKENKRDEELEEELFLVYSNKKEMKKLNKEINSLSMINFFRKLIRFYNKKDEDNNVNNDEKKDDLDDNLKRLEKEYTNDEVSESKEENSDDASGNSQE